MFLHKKKEILPFSPFLILIVLLPCLCHLHLPNSCTFGSVITWRKHTQILRDAFDAEVFYSLCNFSTQRHHYKFHKIEKQEEMLSRHLLLPL